MEFKKTVLDSGVRVLSEHHKDSRCVVTGFWVSTGTRFENRKVEGISHLLEHMVFKGTEKYNALELVLALESRGGDVNAFTAREHTCFHTTSLKEDLDLSVDVLSQVTAHAKFDQKEFEKEKRVVQQEILMSADDLEEYVYDLYYEKIFPNHPLGYQILGSTQTVESITLDDIQNWYDNHFVAENIIVTAAGSIDHDELVRSVENHLKDKTWKGDHKIAELTKPQEAVVYDHVEKDCEQFHIVVGFPACSYADDDRFNGYVLNTALGGGMTSKLYQKVREERGLVYSIFGMLNTFTDCGIQTIYAGTEKKHVEEVVDLIRKELELVKKNGLTSEEVDMFKRQAKGQIIIGSEDIDNRMNSIAVNEMVFGEYRTVEQVISEIDKINLNTINQYIEDKLDLDRLSLFTLGSENLNLKI